MLFERSLVFVQKTLIDFEQKVQKLRLHKYHAISKVFRVWESFPEVRIGKRLRSVYQASQTVGLVWEQPTSWNLTPSL